MAGHTIERSREAYNIDVLMFCFFLSQQVAVEVKSDATDSVASTETASVDSNNSADSDDDDDTEESVSESKLAIAVAHQHRGPKASFINTHSKHEFT